MILVTGATGNVGRAVVAQLLPAGVKVRALTRDPARAALPPEVEVVAGDLGVPSSLPAALAGVTKVFGVAVGHRHATHDANLARAAGAAGVEHIVQLSSLAVMERADNVLTRWHIDGERAIRDSGVPWTMLRPSGFMSNALRWASAIRADGVVRAPFAELATAVVDPHDIAAVGVAALLGSGHVGAEYPLTGPAALTQAEQVSILASVLGRPLRFEPVSPADARAAMARHLPLDAVDAVLQGRERAGSLRARVFPTVREVTGREPRSFHDWATTHAAAFD